MALTLNDEDFEAAMKIMREESQVRRDKRMLNNKRSLQVGSIVEWTGRKSGTCTGEVVRVKTKKAIVKQTNGGNLRQCGMNWDIPMSMLKVVG
ncbi:MAG: hypothetical protein VX294_04615 [Candidatus Latescibacterota bacterium]|nr:hypothetical protein [Candidatus Latescibacterota bacterium]